MKVILLCGGFAKRLWPLTKDKPKPLLPVGGRPILEYIIEKIEEVDDIDRIYLTTNRKFDSHFVEWLKRGRFKHPIEVVIEPAEKDEHKIGAIGAIANLITQRNIHDDLLVIAGDNLFDFKMLDFLEKKHHGFPVVAFYDMGSHEAVKGKYGVAKLDDKSKVVHFEEKPEKPESTLVSAGCYYFPKSTLEMIKHYVSRGNNPDAPGYFIRWLHKKVPVIAFVFGGKWFDIGSHECYAEADRFYCKE